jgi:cytoskeletal protein RodZ
MPTVAEQLKQAREAKNLTINEVADATKIRSSHIHALETGEYSEFPAAVYIRGFVKTYANFLKLDVEAILKDLDKELAHSEKFSTPEPLTPKGPTIADKLLLVIAKFNWKYLVAIICAILAIVLIYAGYSIYTSYKSKDPLSHLGPGVYKPETIKPNNQTLPLPKK